VVFNQGSIPKRHSWGITSIIPIPVGVWMSNMSIISIPCIWVCTRREEGNTARNSVLRGRLHLERENYYWYYTGENKCSKTRYFLQLYLTNLNTWCSVVILTIQQNCRLFEYQARLTLNDHNPSIRIYPWLENNLSKWFEVFNFPPERWGTIQQPTPWNGSRRRSAEWQELWVFFQLMLRI